MTTTTQLDVNAILARVTGAVVGQFDLSRLLQQVVALSMDTLHAEVCSIFLVEEEDSHPVLHMRAGSGFAGPLTGKARYEIGEGFTGYVAQTGLVFNIKTPEELHQLKTQHGRQIWQGKYDDDQFPGENIFRNLVAVPLKIQDHIVGVLKVENKDLSFGSSFSAEDELYCITIANVVALAIENARLHERIEGQSKAMAALAAHRIGNQLASFSGIELDLLDEVAAPVADKEVLRELVDQIREVRESARRLIEDLMRYGKPIQLSRSTVDIRKVIEDEKWLSKPPKTIEFLLDYGPDLPECSLDAVRIAEAVKQLIKNSIRALKSQSHQSGRIEISAKRDADAIVIMVADDGPGFPPDFPLFKPYETTDPQGTGLGLITVKDVVEAHGGQVRAENREQGGAIVEMRLPLTTR